MVFSSIIFLFFFLPLVLLSVPIPSIKIRNVLLLFFSLVFYAWGEGYLIGLLLLSIITNYSFGLLISGKIKKKKLFLGIGIAINLILLGYFKYFNFVIDNLEELGIIKDTISLEVELPIGISFFTFQGISYLIDVYRQEGEVQRNPLQLGLYIALFPQLIAGPIIRYRDIAVELKNRKVSLDGLVSGLMRFIQGLAKKVLIANNVALIADEVFAIAPSELPFSIAWLGVICYAFQIYFDFSGYSDMAIGLGRMFGFHFKENFDFPYLAQSIREFWRRWHISLSNWFRDYLYIPLGGNRMTKSRTYLNLIVVFFLTGLWHGASWNFVLWGLFHGCFLILERNFSFKMPRLIKQLYTLLVVLFAWVLFRAETFDLAVTYYQAMFGMFEGSNYYPLLLMDGFHTSILILSFLSIMPFTQRVYRQIEAGGIRIIGLDTFKYTIHLFLFLLITAELAGGSYNPFIYFRF